MTINDYIDKAHTNATENKVWTCYSIEELEDLLEAKFGGNIAGI